MQTQSKLFIGIGLIILIVIGFSLSGEDEQSNLASHDSNMADSAEMMDDGEMMDDDKVEAVEMMDDEDGEMMDDDKTDMETVHPASPTDVVMGDEKKETMSEALSAPLAAGIYTEYSPEAVTTSDAKHIVLNFSATWCPSCRTVDKDINANISSIPAGVEIYKVDYDTNVALRKQYGITTQHTFVVVNSDGSMIKKWSGGSTLKDVLGNL